MWPKSSANHNEFIETATKKPTIEIESNENNPSVICSEQNIHGICVRKTGAPWTKHKFVATEIPQKVSLKT